MKFFVERPIAVIMLYLALSILGVFSFLNTPLELAPKEDFPQITISTAWTDVPPEIMQTQITAVLEEIASTVKGLKKLTSSSSIGNSQITLDFDPKTDMEFATLALQEKISRILKELPYGVRPQLQAYVPEEFQTQPFLEYTISGSYPLEKMREMLRERMEYGLGAIKGVQDVQVFGGSDPEIRVVLDEKRLQSLNVHPLQVENALSLWNQTFPAGKVRKGQQEYLFKISSLVASRSDLENIIISRSGDVPVKLKDVAEVVPSYADINNIFRINGQPTISLTVMKEKGTSTLKVAKAAKAKLEEIKKQLPPDLVFRKVNDESEEIGKNLKELYILAGIILPVIFLVIFVILRSIKPSFLIFSSIFFSVLFTFNLIYLFKIPMNMLTLGALALGFGMFVDNSIVVFENILRLREQGMSPVEAAIQGPREVFVAILASTLTTVCVFFTFPYFQGRLRMYYLPLAIVISSALAASMFVSFSLIPALSPRLLSMQGARRREKLRPAYEKILKTILRRPVEVFIVMALILFGSYRWFKKEVTIGEWFRWRSQDQLYISIGMPPGTEIQTIDEVVWKFENKVLEKDYKKEMTARLKAENAYVIIKFPTEIEYSYRPYVLKEELIQLATQFAGLNVYIGGFDPQGYSSSMEAGTFYSSHIKFMGYNLKKLDDITGELERRLRQNPRIKDTKKVSSSNYWWRVDSFEHVLKIDQEKLRRFNIDPAYLYANIRSLIRGRMQISPLRLKLEGKEIPVVIKFPEAEKMDLVKLQDALIRTPSSEYLRLRDITTLEERPIAGSIDRENQQFQQTLLWEFRGPSKAEENYRKAVFSSLQLPPGFSATMEETWRMSEEEMTQIKFAIIISLIVIFMILAALYESLIDPFFVMLAVPLELIGVFIAFIAAGATFDSSAYIGVILLGGIVVNNAILLVDHINLKKRQGIPFLEAVVQGSRERIRPIFLTAGTTVFGMLPLVLIQTQTGRNRIWSSLALSTVGGLTSSTLFILIVVPVFYFHGNKMRVWAQKRFQELRSLKEKF